MKRVEELIDARFRQIQSRSRDLVVEEVGFRTAWVRARPIRASSGPAAPISGASMFSLADSASMRLHRGCHRRVGNTGIDAVTSYLNINFRAKPEPADMTPELRLFRLDRRLPAGDVELSSEGAPELVAHAIAALRDHSSWGKILPIV